MLIKEMFLFPSFEPDLKYKTVTYYSFHSAFWLSIPVGQFLLCILGMTQCYVTSHDIITVLHHITENMLGMYNVIMVIRMITSY